MAKGVKTGGRKKGTPNKVTSTVKDNVLAVFDKIGGVNQMAVWAQENPTDFYRIYARMLPQESKEDGSEDEVKATPVKVEVAVVDARKPNANA